MQSGCHVLLCVTDGRTGMVFAEGQKFMFAKYGVALACTLAMQINVCV